jgi:DNA-binding NarL/FixJ family response regulator
MKGELDAQTFAQAWARGPERLAELLPQSDSKQISWPMTPQPEEDSPELFESQPATPTAKAPSPASSNLPESLTPREKDVLGCLIQGMTDPQIAEELVISPRTVHAHLRNIYSKLGVNSRTAATRWAVEHDLV